MLFYQQPSDGCFSFLSVLLLAGFSLLDKPAGSNDIVSLQGLLGPKLLVSDKSTFDQPVLRWRFRVTGNRAVEFGVVPTDLVVKQPCVLTHGVCPAFGLCNTHTCCMNCVKRSMHAGMKCSMHTMRKLYNSDLLCKQQRA